MARKALLDPLPGDRFKTRSNVVYEILDRVVSVAKGGSETPAVIVRRSDKDGTKEICWMLSVLKNQLRRAELISVRHNKAMSWTKVKRVAHDELG